MPREQIPLKAQVTTPPPCRSRAQPGRRFTKPQAPGSTGNKRCDSRSQADLYQASQSLALGGTDESHNQRRPVAHWKIPEQQGAACVLQGEVYGHEAHVMLSRDTPGNSHYPGQSPR